METLRFVSGVILPYAALLVFLAGMLYRIYVWRKLPSPAITLFPAPPDEAANVRNTVEEALLFKSLFKGDRVLWLGAWLFHATLALIFAGHLRVFTNADALLEDLGMTKGVIDTMSAGAGGAAGVLILATALVLAGRRVAIRRVREITGLADCLALGLVGAILVTGNMMRFAAGHFDLNLAREYFAGLASLADVRGARVLGNDLFVVHMFLALVLIMVIPFSKILHFGGIFFTHQLIRKH